MRCNCSRLNARRSCGSASYVNKIPIVMSPATNSIGSGFVKSFARPGGNLTGVANLYGDMTAKTVEILHTIPTLGSSDSNAKLLWGRPVEPGA